MLLLLYKIAKFRGSIATKYVLCPVDTFSKCKVTKKCNRKRSFESRMLIQYICNLIQYNL
nr:MAG TPA: hypothetical protein [Caudoviricetes sp.]